MLAHRREVLVKRLREPRHARTDRNQVHVRPSALAQLVGVSGDAAVEQGHVLELGRRTWVRKRCADGQLLENKGRLLRPARGVDGLAPKIFREELGALQFLPQVQEQL